MQNIFITTTLRLFRSALHFASVPGAKLQVTIIFSRTSESDEMLSSHISVKINYAVLSAIGLMAGPNGWLCCVSAAVMSVSQRTKEK